MGTLYAELDERLRKFIARQPVFFVATAPCLTDAYLDLTGSGAEPIAHLRPNICWTGWMRRRPRRSWLPTGRSRTR